MNGSTTVLNTKPLNVLSLSKYLGSKYLDTVSNISIVPILFNVEPQITGIISPLCIPIVSPFCISCASNSSPLKYLSSISSSVSAISSIRASFTLIASSLNSPSNSSIFSNILCSFTNFLSLYIGIIIGTILFPYCSLNISNVSLYLDFSLSILFINIILGTSSVNSKDFSVPT